MTATQTIWAFTLALTFSAGWIDWRTRRIPNWLTVPCVALGIGINSVFSGWRGA